LSPPLVSILHLLLAIKCLLSKPALIVLVNDEASLGEVIASNAKVLIKPKVFFI